MINYNQQILRGGSMKFHLPIFEKPDFSKEAYKNAKNVTVAEVEKDGVAPDHFYLTTHLPTL